MCLYTYVLIWMFYQCNLKRTLVHLVLYCFLYCWFFVSFIFRGYQRRAGLLQGGSVNGTERHYISLVITSVIKRRSSMNQGVAGERSTKNIIHEAEKESRWLLVKKGDPWCYAPLGHKSSTYHTQLVSPGVWWSKTWRKPYDVGHSLKMMSKWHHMGFEKLKCVWWEFKAVANDRLLSQYWVWWDQVTQSWSHWCPRIKKKLSFKLTGSQAFPAETPTL